MLPPLQLILPSLIGLGALTAGTYSLVNPQSASRLYGISPSSTSPSSNGKTIVPDILTFLDAPAATAPATKHPATKPSTHKQSQNSDDQSHLSLHTPLAIRNISTGLAILLLAAYWQTILSNPNLPQLVSNVVQHVLGLVILAGSFVPFVDAWVCWSSRTVSAWRAACLHSGRGMVWVGTGLWLVQGGGRMSQSGD